MGKSYGENDIVGVHLYLPKGGRPRLRKREAVFWGRKVFWKEEPPLTDEPRKLEGSFVAFYLNGEKQGEVRGLLEGTYFPALSPFTLPNQEDPVVLRCKLGPEELRFQPPVSKPWSEVQAVV